MTAVRAAESECPLKLKMKIIFNMIPALSDFVKRNLCFFLKKGGRETNFRKKAVDKPHEIV